MLLWVSGCIVSASLGQMLIQAPQPLHKSLLTDGVATPLVPFSRSPQLKTIASGSHASPQLRHTTPCWARHLSLISGAWCQGMSMRSWSVSWWVPVALVNAPDGQALTQSPQNVHSLCLKFVVGKPPEPGMRMFSGQPDTQSPHRVQSSKKLAWLTDQGGSNMDAVGSYWPLNSDLRPRSISLDMILAIPLSHFYYVNSVKYPLIHVTYWSRILEHYLYDKICSTLSIDWWWKITIDSGQFYSVCKVLWKVGLLLYRYLHGWFKLMKLKLKKSIYIVFENHLNLHTYIWVFGRGCAVLSQKYH